MSVTKLYFEAYRAL